MLGRDSRQQRRLRTRKSNVALRPLFRKKVYHSMDTEFLAAAELIEAFTSVSIKIPPRRIVRAMLQFSIAEMIHKHIIKQAQNVGGRRSKEQSKSNYNILSFSFALCG